MKYIQPFGISDPDASYINGNPATGTMGSIPPAASLEHDMREIVEVIFRANQRGYHDFTGTACAAPTDLDLQQLRKAIEGSVNAGIAAIPPDAPIIMPFIHYGFATEGPNDYGMWTINPPNGFTVDVFRSLIVIPLMTNRGAVTLNTLGAVRNVLRNDVRNLEAGDWLAGQPYLITMYNDGWRMVGLCNSQVPIRVSAGIDVWIRTDGNDATGDGTQNSAARAYRTLKGAWSGVGGRYAANPNFSLNFRLGIPGDYAGAEIGPFGGSVTLQGDTSAGSPGRHLYRMINDDLGTAANLNHWCSLQVNGISGFAAYGLSFLLDKPSVPANRCIRLIDSNGIFVGCQCEVLTSNPTGGHVLFLTQNANFAAWEGDFWIRGNNQTISGMIYADFGSSFRGAYTPNNLPCHFHIDNLTCTRAFHLVSALSSAVWGWSVIHPSNCIGKKHELVENSVLTMYSQPQPGTIDGTVASGAQFTP